MNNDFIEVENDEVLNEFNNQKNRNEFLSILNELLNPTKIKLITDLSNDEIKLITRIEMIAKIRKLPIYTECTDLFMRLQLSNKRKSRQEIIEAVKGYSQQMNLLNRMGIGRSGGGRL